MLHDGQQFDVRVAHPLHVLHQRDGHLPVREALAVRLAHPRFEMDFVDRNRLPSAIGLPAALVHPCRIAPFVGRKVADHGSGLRRHLARETVRIGLQLPVSGEPRLHVILVGRSLVHARE